MPKTIRKKSVHKKQRNELPVKQKGLILNTNPVKSNYISEKPIKNQATQSAITITAKPDIKTSLFSGDVLKDVHGYAYDDLLPNPDPVIRKLGLYTEANFYENIMTDDQVEACLESISDGVLSLEWEIYQNEADDKIFEAVKSFFKNIDVEKAIEQLIETPCYGRQYMAVDWQFLNGMFIPTNLEAYPLELFQYKTDGVLKMKSDSFSYEGDVPQYRLLNPRFKSTLKNPYGRSILSKCYWLTFFKKNARQYWNIYSEKYGMPWIKAEIDYALMQQFFPNQDVKDVSASIVNLLKNMVQDAIFALPKGIDTTIEKVSDNSSVSNFKMLEDSMNLAITRVILGHSGSSLPTSGKLGNETGAMNIRADKITSRKRIVTKTFRKLIQWFGEINFSKDIELPLFRFYEEDDINKELADVLATLYPAGIIPLPALIEKEFGWKAGEDFVIVEQPSGQTPAIKSELIQKLMPIAQAINDGELTNYEQVESQVKAAYPEIKPLQVEHYIGLAIEYSDRLQI